MKSVHIDIRISPTEKEELIRKAEKARRTLTAFMIESAAHSTIHVVEGIPKLTLQISKIGNNINQIVRLAQTNGYVSYDDVSTLKDDLQAVNDLLYNFIKDMK